MGETQTPIEYADQREAAVFLKFLELWRQAGRGWLSASELLEFAERAGVNLGRAQTLRGRQGNLGRLLSSVPGVIFKGDLWEYQIDFLSGTINGKAGYQLCAMPRDSP